jgi:hypothetical protein
MRPDGLAPVHVQEVRANWRIRSFEMCGSRPILLPYFVAGNRRERKPKPISPEEMELSALFELGWVALWLEQAGYRRSNNSSRPTAWLYLEFLIFIQSREAFDAA